MPPLRIPQQSARHCLLYGTQCPKLNVSKSNPEGINRGRKVQYELTFRWTTSSGKILNFIMTHLLLQLQQPRLQLDSLAIENNVRLLQLQQPKLPFVAGWQKGQRLLLVTVERDAAVVHLAAPPVEYGEMLD